MSTTTTAASTAAPTSASQDSAEYKLALLQERLKGMEEKYKGLNAAVVEAAQVVHGVESELLVCLQKLLPKLKDPSKASGLEELEDKQVELNEKLADARSKLAVDEHASLQHLQQLMPLQNAYLSNIINSLQAKLQEQEKKHADELVALENELRDELSRPVATSTSRVRARVADA
jgi:hypothetical protein